VIKSTLSIAIEGIKDAVGVIRDLIAILDSLMTAASQALGGNFTAAATSLQIISNFTGTVLDDINANIDAQQSRVRAMVSSLSQIQLETLAAMDLTPLGDVFTEAVAKAIADGVRQGAMDGAKDITTIFQNMGLFDAQFLGPPNISVFGADLMGPPQLRTISHFKAPDPALLTDTVGTAQSAMQTMGGVFTEFAGLVEAVTGRLDTGFGRVLRALQSLLGIVEKMQGLGAIFGVGGVASDLAGGAAKQFGKEIGKASAQETARQSASSGGGGSALGKIAAALGPIAAIASAAIAFKGGPQTIKLKTASRSQIEEAALQAFNARRDIRDFLESDMFVRKTDDGAFFTQLGGRVGLVETIEPSFQGTTELPGFQREFFRNGDTHVTVQAMDSRSFHNFNDDMDNQAGRDSLRQFGG
ncbi:MAG: hypothetical protein KAT00_15530, partial [Planctomycetes bacterium]|nr:hypothetical protein [Planctomycetota bacterium]